MSRRAAVSSAALAAVVLTLAVGATAGSTPYEPLYPMVSPDGSQIAWVEGATWKIYVASADGTGAHVVASPPTTEGISQIAWTPEGMVVDSNFSLFLLTAAGKPVRLGPAGFEFAFGGTRLASGPERGPGRFVVIDTGTRKIVRMGSAGVNNSYGTLTADGSRVAWSGGGSVWAAPVGGTPRRLAARAGCPVWSPDGRSIAFERAPADLRVLPAAGGPGRLLLARGAACGATEWSPDSTTIAVACARLTTVDVRTGAVKRTPASMGRIAGGFAWSHDGSSIYVTVRPLARERAHDNCTSLWQLDAATLRGRILVRGCA